MSTQGTQRRKIRSRSVRSRVQCVLSQHAIPGNNIKVKLEDFLAGVIPVLDMFLALRSALQRVALARPRRFILLAITPYQKNDNDDCHRSNDRQDRRMSVQMDEFNNLTAIMRGQESQYAVPYNATQSQGREKFLQ